MRACLWQDYERAETAASDRLPLVQRGRDSLQPARGHSAPAPDRTRKSEYTPWTLGHVYDTSDVEKETFDKFNKQFNLKPAPYKPQKP
jgi:hypothetical protein